MTVVPQTYTATATWTAVQLADTFKQAFIDAGLMTDWFDTFLSGTVENRILRVIHDGAKTYGTVYYWFMFTTTGVFVNTTNTWNATTHVPTGTVYLDYFSTATNTTGNHATLLALVNTTTCTVTRYTSGINSGATVFLIRNGTNNRTFILSHPSFNAQSFIDLNKVTYNGLLTVVGGTTSNLAWLQINQLCHTRTSYLGGVPSRGSVAVQFFTNSRGIYRYAALGNVNNTFANIDDGNPYVFLPVATTNTHSALASNHLPVFTSPTISPYMPQFPSDFGFATYYASSAMTVQDTLVVTAGTEEWEMMAIAVNSTVDAGRIFFLARTV